MGKLTIPDDFYYEARVEGDEFSTQPSPYLAFQQIIKGRDDFYIKTQPVISRKQKTLILNDWTLCIPNSRLGQFKKEYLKQLMEESSPPFEILACSINGLLPLNLDNLDSFFHYSPPFLTKSEVNEILKQNDLNIEHCLHLDHLFFQRIHHNIISSGLKDHRYYAYQISLSDLNEIEKQENINLSFEKLLSIANSYQEQGRLILCRDTSSKEYKRGRANKLTLDNQEITVVPLWMPFKISENDYENFFLPQLKEMVAENRAWGNFRYQSEYIKEASLNNLDTSPELFSKFLVYTSGIERLFLPKFSEGQFQLEKKLPSLKEILLSHSSISPQQFSQFLSYCDQLESLTISNSDVTQQLDWQRFPRFASLKKIRLAFLNKTIASSLGGLLAHSPNLQRLEIFANEIEGTIDWQAPQLKKLSFDKLECIFLYLNNGIITNELKQLISRCPNIKRLDLCLTKIHQINWQEMDLSSLEEMEIIFFHQNMDTKTLQDLFKAAPNLKKLHFKSEKLNQINLEGIKLDSLKTLHLTSCQFDSQSLCNLLSSAPCLKEFIFEKSTIENDDWDAIQLTDLRTIALHESNIPAKKIKEILRNSPELKAIEFHNLSQLKNIDVSTLSNTFINIESIVIHDDNIDYDKIALIFCYALRSAKKISIKNIHPQTNGWNNHFIKTLIPIIPKGKYFPLEELTLHSYDDFDYEFLSHFLKQCKYLKRSSIIPSNEKQVSRQKNWLNEFIPPHKTKPMSASSSRASSSQNTPTHTSSSFQLNQYLNRAKPKTDFDYRGIFEDLSQNMVVEQFSQYLTLSQKNLNLIPRIQRGICFALSACFLKSEKNWNESLERVKKWDGTETNLTEALREFFEDILQIIEQYHRSAESISYLGDHLDAFLKNAKGSYLISNLWHRIAISYDESKTQWHVYDPNYKSGSIFVKRKELHKLLIREQGHILSVVAQENIAAKDSIKDINLFLARGGFLLLLSLKQRHLFEFVQNNKKINALTLDALKGLLLQNLTSVPAWVLGLMEQHTGQYFKTCIQACLKRQPSVRHDFKSSLMALPDELRDSFIRLLDSISKNGALSPEQFEKARQQLNQWREQHSRRSARKNKKKIDIKPQQTDTSRTKQASKEIKNIAEQKQERPSEKTPQEQPSANIESQWINYYSEKFSPKQKMAKEEGLYSPKDSKLLLQTESLLSQHDCLLKIYQQAKQDEQPVFWVKRPQDLICSSQWLHHQHESCEIQDGPGGPLYDFLNSVHPENKRPLLLIDCSHFKPEDIIHNNNMLDKTRKIGNEKLSDNIQIIAVQNINDKNAYLGEDFLSRFDKRKRYLARPAEPWQFKSSTAAIAASSSEESIIEIDLYEGSDWLQRLTGYPELNDTTLKWVEGDLIRAARLGKKLIIHNGPQNDPEYRLFWQRLSIDKSIDGYPLDLDNIEHHQGYDWNSLLKIPQFKEASTQEFFNENLFLCNQESFNKLFSCYVINNETHGLIMKPGLIDSISSLHLLLTENLTKAQWAKLLSKVHLSNKERPSQMTVTIEVLAGVTLPANFPKPQALMQACSSAASSQKPQASNIDSIIYTNDRDACLHHLLLENPNAICLDISGIRASDLLKNQKAELNQKERKFYFEEKIGYLAHALQTTEKTFLLSGKFDPELFNALLPYVRAYPQRLRIVGEDWEQIKAFSPVENHFSIEEKRACLPKEEQQCIKNFSNEKLKSFSLARLKALAAYQKLYPQNEDPHAPWNNYYKLRNTANFSPVNYQKAGADSHAFLQERFALIESHLDNSPFVFIGGMTGVGKSTFIARQFSEKYQGQVYLNEDKISEWAANPQGGYLFIDEANISQRDWSEFEGLFNKTPSIYIDGKLEKLTPMHKVIFAGNPLNYGGSRHQASFFERHGHSVLFEPLPPAVIYHNILNPIFSDTALRHHIEPLSDKLLEAYQLLVSLSEDKILVTPRQLKSVAMLCLAEFEDNADKDPVELIQKYILMILKPLAKAKEQPQFDHRFQIARPDTSESLKIDEFKITDSRKPASTLLSQFLKLREYKRKNHQSLNDTQKYGDLCSLVLESMPGLGKTELLKALMKAHAIQEGDIESKEPQNNVYYHLPVNLSLDIKTSILRKAFNEGNIVIIDEINSSPMIERLLNALLSGTTPEGTKPAQPGFMLLGTQNPISMGARISQTEAQKKRMVCLSLPEYPEEEIKEILIHKGMPEQHAQAMTKAFKRQSDIAQHHQISPPNFRALERIAEDAMAEGLNDFNQPIPKKQASPAASSSSSESPSSSETMERKEQAQSSAPSDDVTLPSSSAKHLAQSEEQDEDEDETENEILTLLLQILSNQAYWTQKTWFDPLPTTVLRIKEALERNARLATIKQIADTAARQCWGIRFFHHRHDDTQRFYTLLSENDNNILLENLEKFATSALQESMQEAFYSGMN